MKGGKLVEHGPAEQVLTRPHHDYTKTLLQAVPRFAATT
jgi:peptide/nickel transport system ATP-binding protein